MTNEGKMNIISYFLVEFELAKIESAVRCVSACSPVRKRRVLKEQNIKVRSTDSAIVLTFGQTNDYRVGATHLLSFIFLRSRAFARGYKQGRAYSTSIFASEKSENIFAFPWFVTHSIDFITKSLKNKCR